ncbi:N-acetyltransferase [Candidatus Sulfurimonas baltica]|uniref:N-acetyltransferase n=1 Tax=Candidatus Sulfurimonas baltica TaxID=2740404 RepID=A0A7S7LTR1_9BACT|nr:N-acetyltransferase [Candidatus Sulfurimonas baltica]QOY51190.1 N-acetyltransferase [Candidatus Sulfurimonas baltica]
MAHMIDPTDGLISLQDALNKKLVEFTNCELSQDIVMHVDQPEGIVRFSYAKILNGEIQSYTVFVMAEPIDGTVCLNLGYAVPKKYRNQGFAQDILKKSIIELKNGLGRNNIKEFYLEAIIGTDNEVSQKIASNIISNSPKKCKDAYSGQDALAYTKLIK